MDKDLNLLYEIKEIKSLLKNIEKRLEDIESKAIDKHIVLNERDKILNVDNIWNSAKDIIKRELTEVSFNTWIKPVTQFKIEGNIIYLQVCNDFSKSILESRYMDLLKNAINQVMGNSCNIKLVIEGDSEKEAN